MYIKDEKLRMKLISLSEMARKYLSGPPMEELIR